MSHELTLGPVLNAISGVLMVGIGIFVARLKGQPRANRAFAFFSIVFGATWIVDNLTVGQDHLIDPGGFATGVLMLTAGIGVAWMAMVYPTPLSGARDRRHAALAAFAGASIAAAYLAVDAFAFDWGALLAQGSWDLTRRVGQGLLQGFLWFALYLFVLRHHTTPGQREKDREAYRLMSAALILYPAFFLSSQTSLLISQGVATALIAPGVLLTAAATGLFAGLWMIDPRDLTDPRGATDAPDGAKGTTPAGSVDAQRRGSTMREALPWLGLVTVVVGLAMGPISDNNPGFGISRTIGVAILAYAIVRHQLFDIDLKVKGGLEKSTVAAAFVAVFFIVSETIESILAGSVGTWAGLGAAGALTFVLRPLEQKVGQVADRVMPGVEDTDAYRDRRKAEVYRTHLERVAPNGQLGPGERGELDRLRESLEMDPGRAEAIEDEVWSSQGIEGVADGEAGPA